MVEEGNVDGALDICGNMRLDPDLGWPGYTERAIVNLFIIRLNDPEGFDITKFAEEALKLAEDKNGDHHEMIARMEEQASQLTLELQLKKLQRSVTTASAAEHTKDGVHGAKVGQGDIADDDFAEEFSYEVLNDG